jgi:hypothetical protein
VKQVADTRTVSLLVPADPEFLVFARLALGAVCRLTSLGSDEVLDLKLAVTEAAAGVLDEDDEPRDATERIGFAFGLEAERLVLEVRGWLPSDISAEERRLGKAIVEATVDGYEDLGDAIRLEKRLPADERLG